MVQFDRSFFFCTKGHHDTTMSELESVFGLQDGNLTESLSAISVVTLKCTG